MDIGWIGCAIKQANPKRLRGFFFPFYILICFLKYETIETHTRAFLPLDILAVGSVYSTYCFLLIQNYVSEIMLALLIIIH